MESVPETERKSPSAPHTVKDGVKGKVCGGARAQTRKNSKNCFKWCALSEYPLNYAYQDGHSGTCRQCKKDSRGESVTPSTQAKRDTALAFTKSDQVQVRGVGNVTIGWHGDAQYWPVKPLVRLANMRWGDLFKAIKADPLLASVVRLFLTTGSDGKQYEMICMPWSHWHTFWLKFGNADTLQVQQDAQRVLERAFGDTAEKVQQQTARAHSGSIPLLDLETYRKNRHRFKALDEADNQIDQARQEATAALIKAQVERVAADRLIAEAKERQHAAQQAEQEAQQRIDEAAKQQAAIEAELNKLLGQDAEWVYDFGRESDLTPMYASGKFGDTGNPQQRRKALRQGDTRYEFRIKRPCDSAKGVADQCERYYRTFGTIRGNDGYENVPRKRYDRLIAVMQEHEYIEVEWFTQWVSEQIAHSVRYQYD